MDSTFEWRKTKQLSIVQLLLAIFIPSGVAYFGFHFVLPRLVENGLPVMMAWPSVASVMLLGLVVVAIILLQREANGLGISLRERLCWKSLSWKEWGIYIGIMLLAIAASQGVQGLIPAYMKMFGLSVPTYMPFFLNPTITNPMTTDPSVLSPGLPLQGNYGLLPLIGITLLLNILSEEFYFRAWMLPKLSKYGNWGWIMNGALFALYHTFQIWLLPVILVASLCFAYVFYRSKSVLPSLTGHLIANFLLSILGILLLIIG
jgi:membrane protease YdiL (CAAX protease family)